MSLKRRKTLGACNLHPPGLSQSSVPKPPSVSGIPAATGEAFATVVPDIPNGQWKALLELPMHTAVTGQPWETALAFTTWKRQFVAVCETVSGPFVRYVEGRFDAAEKRHETRMSGGSGEASPTVEKKYRDRESRLVVGLLKVLPQDVKSAVVEDPNTTMTSLGLLEEVVTLAQPGGGQ